MLLIGGGSNLVISDEGFPGTVIHVNTRGIVYADAGDGAVDVTVAAGEDWDDVVAATAAEGLAGLESLSGIPGRAGRPRSRTWARTAARWPSSSPACGRTTARKIKF